MQVVSSCDRHGLGGEHANKVTRTPDTVQRAVKVAKVIAVTRAVEPGRMFLIRAHRDILAQPRFAMYSMQAA